MCVFMVRGGNDEKQQMHKHLEKQRFMIIHKFWKKSQFSSVLLVHLEGLDLKKKCLREIQIKIDIKKMQIKNALFTFF